MPGVNCRIQCLLFILHFLIQGGHIAVAAFPHLFFNFFGRYAHLHHCFENFLIGTAFAQDDMSGFVTVVGGVYTLDVTSFRRAIHCRNVIDDVDVVVNRVPLGVRQALHVKKEAVVGALENVLVSAITCRRLALRTLGPTR